MANKAPCITCLFLDVGGVLLTNGWDHLARKRAAKHFGLDWVQMDERHRLTFETHEEGRLSFDRYLDLVVFYEKRSFSRAQFRRFVFDQSKPYADVIGLIGRLKAQYSLRIVIVSNESREVNAYRIQTYKLDTLADAFISSCFVHLRKPDLEIFRLALDIAQKPANQILYIENTPMFLQIAASIGIQGILHTDYQSTCEKLATFGLTAHQ